MKSPIANSDFGLTADDYSKYRAGFPDSLFPKLKTLDIGTGKQKILDLGTGTGTLARGFATSHNEVWGIDPAEEMLVAARKLDEALKLTINYHVAPAENTGLTENQFDIVSAGQCWHWFEPKEASLEIKRLLKADGTFLAVYYDWLPLQGNVVKETETLIECHNPDWKGGNQCGIHPTVFRDLGENGFYKLESFTYDEPAIYTHEGWRGRIRASAGVGATMNHDQIQAFDTELANLLTKKFSKEPLIVPHRVFVLTAKCKE
ncbi:MAG: SAM-dependent methyltransferase [Candidatus Azotimanducaceae bacterium]|jgi:SAM-dependent methyltransferase